MGATRCPKNPDCDTFCTVCNKVGHSEATCWTKVRKNVVFAEAKKNKDKADEKVTLEEEPQSKPKAVNETKRLSDG